MCNNYQFILYNNQHIYNEAIINFPSTSDLPTILFFDHGQQQLLHDTANSRCSLGSTKSQAFLSELSPALKLTRYPPQHKLLSATAKSYPWPLQDYTVLYNTGTFH